VPNIMSKNVTLTNARFWTITSPRAFWCSKILYDT